MAKGGKKGKGSKPVPKGGACFMKFNSAGKPYRVCKSGAELEFEKKRAAKNKKKRNILEQKRKEVKKLDKDIAKKKAELKKVEKNLKKKSNKK
tara:strand:+ start:1016 stop:1294 length:279 start_codon:yes stop_codon:yes gene_type:complete